MQKGFVTTEKKEKNADFYTLSIFISMIQNSAKSLWLVAVFFFFGTRLWNSLYPSDWRALKKRPFKKRIRKFLLTVLRVEDAYVDVYSLITNLNSHYYHGNLQLCSLPSFIYLFQWYCNNYVTFLQSVYCVIFNSYSSRTRRIWADIYNQRGRRPSWLLSAHIRQVREE